MKLIETLLVGCTSAQFWFQQGFTFTAGLAQKAARQVFWPISRIQLVMDFLSTLTPDEGVLLLLLGLVTLLASLGFALWLVIS